MLPEGLKLARQLYMSGEKGVRKQEFLVKKSLEAWVIIIKLPTGVHLLIPIPTI
ncbi:hypothetical protein IHO40_00075 [Wolbachia endosymbiont of Mansonella ozzardi]|uniref:hypothetical protein n=1 Tax=Wolbachia endosymbiont of Mansonella ozzardi TaxID=137464 RepID=UPI00397CA7BA|nr:hypothetical protein [Wolbachia endosymbiont of Mansonella ozzardi]